MRSATDSPVRSGTATFAVVVAVWTVVTVVVSLLSSRWVRYQAIRIPSATSASAPSASSMPAPIRRSGGGPTGSGGGALTIVSLDETTVGSSGVGQASSGGGGGSGG